MSSKITCNGEHYNYSISTGNLKGLVVYECIIKPHGIITDEFYQVDVTVAHDGSPIITNIQNYDFPLVSGKGLGEVGIGILDLHVGGGVKSSSNSKMYHKIEGEFRTESATRIWKRLTAIGLAIFNNEEDRYCYVSKR